MEQLSTLESIRKDRYGILHPIYDQHRAPVVELYASDSVGFGGTHLFVLGWLCTYHRPEPLVILHVVIVFSKIMYTST